MPTGPLATATATSLSLIHPLACAPLQRNEKRAYKHAHHYASDASITIFSLSLSLSLLSPFSFDIAEIRVPGIFIVSNIAILPLPGPGLSGSIARIFARGNAATWPCRCELTAPLCAAVEAVFEERRERKRERECVSVKMRGGK